MPMSGNGQSDPFLAQILIVGEGPGENEDNQGKQFVGDSGVLLRYGLSQAGITDFALNNAVRCRPPKNRDPKATEWRSCHTLLLKDIESMPNLKLLILCGNYAMRTILGFEGSKKYSGKLYEWTHNGKTYKVMPMLHPSAVLQNQSELGNFLNHIKRIPNALTGTLVNWTADERPYYIVKSTESFNWFIKELLFSGEFSYDIEASGLDPFDPNSYITSMSFAPNGAYTYVLPMDGVPKEMIDKLREVFENPDIKKIGHSIKFDNLWLKVKLGIDVKGTYWDTQIGHYLRDENDSNGLKDLAWTFTKMGGYEVIVGGEPHKAEGHNLWRYNAIDANVTHRIFNNQVATFKGTRLQSLMTTLLIPVTEVLTEMEYRGVRIDPDKITVCKDKVALKLENLHKEIFSIPSVKAFEKDQGEPFNPNSTVQLREVLFKYEGLRPTKLTPKAKLPSTDIDTLKTHVDKSELCRILVDYSTYETMRSKTLSELLNYNRNNRIHTHYWLTESKPGRSSSKEPNLQNVPKSEKDVVNIRSCFLADEDYQLLEADYNQHELRCMAEEANDQALWNAIYSGDVHRATASGILKKDPKLITDDERRNIGKTFNFGFIYGLTKYGVIRRLKCTPEEADHYLSEFFGVYHQTKKWMDATTEFVKKNGYVMSRTGRVRRFPIWNSLDDTSIRQAINAPIQSLAGDILLYALIGVHKFLRNFKSFLTLEIHDSLIMNIHKDELHIIPEIKYIMLNYFRKFVDFKGQLDVDMKIGPSWDTLVKI